MSDSKIRMVEVAVDAPLARPLTYLVPRDLPEPAPGCRVLAPLGRRQVTGYALGPPTEPPGPDTILKPIISILDPEPLFDAAMLKLMRWAAGYYFCPLAEVIKTALPPGINVASERTVAITDAGRAALGDPFAGLPAGQISVLEYIGRGAEVKWGRVEKDLGASASRQLAQLVARGLLRDGLAVRPPRVKVQFEQVLEADRPAGPEEIEALRRRSPEQAKMLDALAAAGRVPLADARELFKDPLRLARALTRRGLCRLVKQPVARDPLARDLLLPPAPRELMPEQEDAVAAVGGAVAAREFKVFLLEGVTGSGKTEVYLRAIERALKEGRGAVMLAPEIALTPQLVSRFRQRFPADELAILHSGLTPGERHDEWWRIRRGRARVVIGARSAVFAPVAGLGVIVVDEEQDGAYKQDHGFMYQARDLAIMRAKFENAAAVLGSATPSLESAYRARQGAYTRLALPRRVDNRPLAKVTAVDLRAARPGTGDACENIQGRPQVRDRDLCSAAELISPELAAALTETLARGEQSLLFLNRRGTAAFMLCPDCGKILSCPNCDVSLSLHHKRPAGPGKVDEDYGAWAEGSLLCHYCGARRDPPEVCPHCRGVRLRSFGVGTERMEQAARELLPGARVLRMDSDAVAGRDGYFSILDRISRRQVDVVVGTQMVAKGHDLPGVTLVGVVLADLGLSLPDFRAAERTFQMLTQVAGRAGRGERPGRVIVQTFAPEHYAIQLALEQDFEKFYARELEPRRKFSYPPLSRLANFRLTGKSDPAVKPAAAVLGRLAKRIAATKAFQTKVLILGPSRAPIARIKNKTRWMMLVKSDDHDTMSAFAAAVFANLKKAGFPGSVELELDRDPVMIM